MKSNNSTSISFLIVDDHPIILDNLTIQIESVFPEARITRAETAEETLAFLRDDSYDLLILDIGLPDSSPLSFIQEVVSLKPKLPILIFSMYPEDVFAPRMLKLGVKGYLNKRSKSEEIILAISQVLSGGRYVSKMVTEVLVDMTIEGKSKSNLHNLSNRELEIAIMMANGKSAKEITAVLNIHSSTIATHKHRIFNKLRIKSLTELIHVVPFMNYY